MKRLITILIFIGLAVVSYGQQLNPKGLYIGKTLPVLPGSMIQRIDSAVVDNMANPTTIWFFHGTDTLIFGIPVAGYEDAYDYVVALLPDTTHVTDPTYTPVVGDQEVYFTDSYVLVTLPTNATAAIPIGSTINFFSYAGLTKFTPEAGATLKSAQDSVTTSKAYQVVGAKKVATNKWWIYGPLEN